MPSKRSDVENETTPYGFRFGAALVERLFSAGGSVAVRVRTKTGRYVDVYVSPTGRSLKTFESSAKTLRF
jgi:hypothetical protein